MPPPAPEIRTRRERLVEQLARRKLGGWLAVRPEDVRYFSGFTGTDAWMLATPRHAWLFTDSRFTEEAEKSTVDCTVVRHERGLPRAAAEHAARARLRRVAFAADATSARALDVLKSTAPRVVWTPADDLADALRAVKSPWEVQRIVAAQRVAERAFAALRPFLRAGVREHDVAVELDHQLRLHGASESAFPTIVAAGARASLPHAQPGTAVVRPGGLLLIDFGARRDGYVSDATRTLFCGEPAIRWRTRYAYVLDAQQAALDALGPDEGGRRAAFAAADLFRRHGVADYFGHGLGHGVGLAVHESPRLAGATTALAWGDGSLPTGPNVPKPPPLLAPGMVVTVEPGLYWPGQGGIRIEDMAVITPSGARNLTRLPKRWDDSIF